MLQQGADAARRAALSAAHDAACVQARALHALGAPPEALHSLFSPAVLSHSLHNLARERETESHTTETQVCETHAWV